VKVVVNGGKPTALGASSALKNEASAGLRRASVIEKCWRGAMANKREQARSRAAQGRAHQGSTDLRLEPDGTPRPNSARRQLGCGRAAGGGRRARSTP
jgi:hypothetical protein